MFASNVNVTQRLHCRKVLQTKLRKLMDVLTDVMTALVLALVLKWFKMAATKLLDVANLCKSVQMVSVGRLYIVQKVKLHLVNTVADSV